MAIQVPPADATGDEPPFYRSGRKLLTLTYQSRAARSPTPDELGALLKQARARNRAGGITGMLLLSDDRFFQWLEGPKEALDQVWASIQHDPRHTHVEVLKREFSQQRLFSDWDMRLISTEAMFETVCHQTRAKRSLPPKLVEMSAKLALEGQLKILRDGLEEVLSMGIDLPTVYSGLIEPTAHLLGDWWQDDLCDEREIALALYSLRSIIREIAESNLPVPALNDNPLRILLIAPPEEPHMLGISLANDLYYQDGHDVVVEFPKSSNEIDHLVRRGRFDVLTFATSDVFTHYGSIDSLASIIGSARRESLNPRIVIVVGGRAFAEKPNLVKQAGADALYITLSEIVIATTKGVEAMREAQRLN